MLMIIYFLLFLAGLFGGFIAGIPGIGTGFIMIAIIPIALHSIGIPESEIVRFTIANTIFATMCSAFANNLRLLLQNQFYKKETIILAISAAITSSVLLQIVVINSSYSKKTYNIIICILLIYIIYRTLNKLRKNRTFKEQVSNLKLTITGLSAGAVAALTGLGGGSLTIPMLNLWMKIDIKKAKSISYGTIFTTALILTIINLYNQPEVRIHHVHFGFILAPIAIPLSAGVIIASPLGMKVGERFSARTISFIFLGVITMVLIKKATELFL